MIRDLFSPELDDDERKDFLRDALIGVFGKGEGADIMLVPSERTSWGVAVPSKQESIFDVSFPIAPKQKGVDTEWVDMRRVSIFAFNRQREILAGYAPHSNLFLVGQE